MLRSKVFQFNRNRYHGLILISIITVTAAILRFYKLGQWSFWIDEAWSIRDSLALGTTTSIFSKSHFLFYLLLKPWVTYLPMNEWNARLLPVLIGIATVPILFLVVRKMFGFWPAILASVFLAVSPWHLYWSQNVRFYTLLLMLYNLALFGFYWGLEKDNLRYIAASVVVWGLAVVSHTTAAILAPILVLYLLLLKVLPFDEPAGFRRKYILPIVLLPVLFVGYEIFGVINGKTTATLTILNKFVLNSSLDVIHAARLATGVVYYIGLPVVCLALFGGIYLLINKWRQGIFLLVAAIVPFLILFAPVSQTRYVFLTLPAWLVLAAIAVEVLFVQLKNYARVIAVGVLLLLVLDPISQDLQYYFFQNGRRWDWKGSYALVQQEKQKNDLVVTTWPELGTYYLDEEVMPIHQTTADMVLRTNQRMWFIDDGWANPTLNSWLKNNAELIDVRTVHLPGKEYETRVYLYEPLKSGSVTQKF